MGIKGLLQLLSPITQVKHLSAYTGKTIGVDASCWLHRSAYTCAYELHNNITTYKYILFLSKLINLLKQYNITPYIVFDGQPLPAKSGENNKRSTTRQQYKQQADALLKTGNKAGAIELYQRCVPITTTMRRNFIELCKSQHIKYIVAHNEADSQLAYMYKNGVIDCVLSEDSDLIAFGVDKLLCKLEMSGHVKEIDLTDCLASYTNNDVHIIMFRKLLQLQRSSDTTQFNDILIEACVLSGCDYLTSPTNIAIKKSFKMFSELFQRAVVLNRIKQNKTCKMSADYEQLFDAAVSTFKYQYVIDPSNKTCIHLNAMPHNTRTEFTPPTISADKENSAVYIHSDTDTVISIDSCNDSAPHSNVTDLSKYIGLPIHINLIHDYMRGKVCINTLKHYTADSDVLTSETIKLIDHNGQLPPMPTRTHPHSQPIQRSFMTSLPPTSNSQPITSIDDTDVLVIKHKKHSLDVPDLNELFDVDSVQLPLPFNGVKLHSTAATSNPFKRPRSTSPAPHNTIKQKPLQTNQPIVARVPLSNKTNSLLSYFQR